MKYFEKKLEENCIIILVGQSIENLEFTKKYFLNLPIVLVNIDNTLIDNNLLSDNIKYQFKFDELNSTFRSDSIDLMFYNNLRLEFYCLQTAIYIKKIINISRDFIILSSRNLPIINIDSLFTDYESPITVSKRFLSLNSLSKDDHPLFSDLKNMGILDFSFIVIRPGARLDELDKLIFESIKISGNPYFFYGTGTLVALANNIVSANLPEYTLLTPWNFKLKDNFMFINKGYLNEIEDFWGIAIPDDYEPYQIKNIYKQLEIDVDKIILDKEFDPDITEKETWAKIFKSDLIGKFIKETNFYSGPISKVEFENWAMSTGVNLRIMNRIEEIIWETRPDLQQTFFPASPYFLSELRKWIFDFGIKEMNIDNKHNYIRDLLIKLIEIKKRALSRLSKEGFNILGYQNYLLGLGQAARDYFEIVNRIGMETSSYSFLNKLSKPINNDLRPKQEGLIFDKNIIIIGADQMSVIDRLAFKGWNKFKYNIGVIFWEIDQLNEEMAENLNIFDEFIVSSEYIFEVLRKYTNKKISVLNLPVKKIFEVKKTTENRIFNLFTNFDFLSDIYRKNIFQLVDFFSKVNYKNNGKLNLTIKSSNSKFFPNETVFLGKMIEKHKNIKWLDGNLETEDYKKLQTETDLYVSLHRSEGYGLGLAEAMARGISVLGTNYSGNLDFMTENNSYLIKHKLVETSNFKRSPYSKFKGKWAEPNLEDFETKINDFLHDEENREKKKKDAIKDVEKKLSVEVISKNFKRIISESGLI